MAVAGLQPFIKVTDSNGLPIVGAKLHVYEAGTTTYRAIYSDASLSVSLSNPLTGSNASDASGDFPRFYMASGTYKLRAVTSADVLIWEFDNIDTGTSAGAGALPIASGGTGGTSAAAARANLDVPSNSELTALSDQIATFSTSLQNLISQPGGRLTLTTATPVLAAGVSAATAVYYTPYISTLCPIYDGTQFNLQTFAELTLTLAAQHVAGNIYDCFIINDSGTIRIVTGPTWAVVTPGSGSRSTGAGTTELTRLNGIWVNAAALATARNGATTYAVSANQGTYVGSLSIDGTNGQVTCHTAYGQSRKWGVWNAYNRVPIVLRAGDTTASWTSAPASWRQSRADTTNFCMAFCGLPEEIVDSNFQQYVNISMGNSTNEAMIGIGVNSTTSPSGIVGAALQNDNISGSFQPSFMLRAEATLLPSLGLNQFNMTEQVPQGTTTNASYIGVGESRMRLALRWRG